MTIPLVSVGLVTWNSASFLPACLEALRKQDHSNLELVIVDNASTDQSVDVVSSLMPLTRLICNPTNTGFCHAQNQAIRASTGQYYLALNPDVTLDSVYISTLVQTLEEKPDYGSAGGKLLLPPDNSGTVRIDSTGLFIDRRRKQYIRGNGEIDTGQHDRAEEVFGLDGAAPLYRMAMLKDIQVFGEFFDESFFAHKEDVDLAWRARLFGWRCWYSSTATAFHKRTFQPGKRENVAPAVRIHAVKNRYFLLLKNESPEGWKRDCLPIIWYDLKIMAYLLFFERSSLAAFGLVRKNWKRILAWRKEIATRRNVTSQQVLGWFK